MEWEISLQLICFQDLFFPILCYVFFFSYVLLYVVILELELFEFLFELDYCERSDNGTHVQEGVPLFK